jgi:hypothetical protein
MPIQIPQVSFGGGVISQSAYARIDLNKFGSAVKQADNYFVQAEGGLSNRNGTTFIKEVKDSTKTTRLITFEFNEIQAYALEFGDLYMRLYSSGGAVLEADQTITAITKANPAVVTISGHGFSNGDQVFINSVGGMIEVNARYFIVANKTTNTFQLTGTDSSAYTTYTSGGTAARVYTITTPYAHTDLAELKFRQSNDVVYMGHVSHAPRKLSRLGATNWTLSAITFAPTQAAPTSPAVSNQGVSGSTTYTYRITSVASETAEESVVLAASTTSGHATLDVDNFNRITFSAASGAERYNIYKEDNGLYGFIGATETTTFDDKGLDADLDDTAPTLRTPFDGSGKYPEAVGMHEQRTWWGNSTNEPLTVWSSQTGQFENTNVSSPTKATDAITLRLVTGKGNEIRHFRSFRNKLFTFTSGAVWTISPGGDADAITPASKLVDVQEYLSCTQVPPLTIKTNILMVAGKANQGFEVHSLGEDINSGVGGNYVGSDLTVLARDLFEGFNILEWCYLERPFRTILAVRDDGDIVCQTYLNEHQIYAWTKWSTNGTWESVCDVPEGQNDTCYMIIKRTINGSAVKYVEQLTSRTYATISDATFIDSHLVYDGTNALTVSAATKADPCVITVTGHPYVNGDLIKLADLGGMTEIEEIGEFTVANKTTNTFELTGVDSTAFTTYTSGGTAQLLLKSTKTILNLDHLEGETTVLALHDGNIESGLTVTSGFTTLANGFVKLCIGMPYTATMETIPINHIAEVLAKKKKVSGVILRVLDTRGIHVGTKLGELEESPTRETEVWGDPAAIKSDVIRVNVSSDWKRDMSVIVQSEPGLPQTILSLVADTNVGGG